jgi:hypothetical protein
MTDRAELLEAALDRIPEGIALLGEDGGVVFWNRVPAQAPAKPAAGTPLAKPGLMDKIKGMLPGAKK